MFPVLLWFPAFKLLRQVSQRCAYCTLIHLHSENFELYILAGSLVQDHFQQRKPVGRTFLWSHFLQRLPCKKMWGLPVSLIHISLDFNYLVDSKLIFHTINCLSWPPLDKKSPLGENATLLIGPWSQLHIYMSSTLLPIILAKINSCFGANLFVWDQMTDLVSRKGVEGAGLQ